jgi:hypothetical protein
MPYSSPIRHAGQAVLDRIFGGRIFGHDINHIASMKQN